MMKTRGGRERTRVAAPLPLWCGWWFLFACALFLMEGGGGAAIGDTRGSRKVSYSQDGSTRIIIRQRQLIGPGSYPPRCMGKCSRCVPCHPVHVTVPPGANVVTEYYPEAWRCKCGRSLYIP